MPIQLSGVYGDTEAREYVILQDAVRRTERHGFIVALRVIRQRDSQDRRGTVEFSSEAYGDAGDSDAAKNDTISRALVSWLSTHPVITEFGLRAIVTVNGNVATTEMYELPPTAPDVKADG